MSEKQDYLFQYRREQRAEFTIQAASLEEAEKLAENHIGSLSLISKDDSSDDPGELECVEEPPQ